MILRNDEQELCVVSKIVVTAVAEHAFARVFALAKITELRLFGCEDDWLKLRPGVLAVAERLCFGKSTRTPSVLLAFFDFDFGRIFGGNFWFIHLVTPS